MNRTLSVSDAKMTDFRQGFAKEWIEYPLLTMTANASIQRARIVRDGNQLILSRLYLKRERGDLSGKVAVKKKGFF